MIEPNGCKYCGIGKQNHYNMWSLAALDAGHVDTYSGGWGRTFVRKDGWHKWVQPSQDQIKERMLKRRLERNG